MVHNEQTAILHFREVICKRVPAHMQPFAYIRCGHRRLSRQYHEYIVLSCVANGLRKQLRMTQEETANKADLAIQVVSNSELGKTAIRPENMLRLCAALEISADYLLTGQIACKDVFIIEQKVQALTPRQFQFLEDIIRQFVNLCEDGEVL